MPRGDNENTRKFAETILAGCIPVLLADMPEWPFARRLDYRRFSFEFDLSAAADDPLAIVRFLLARPAAEVAAKQRELRRIRSSFFYHDQPNRPSAPIQLLHDMCSRPHRRTGGQPSNAAVKAAYRARMAAMPYRLPSE